MKKLTAGILTVMLGIVSANSADAAVASKGYVDAVVKTNADAITNLTTTVNQHTADIAGKVSKSEYNTKIEALETADGTFAKQAYVGTLPTDAGVDNVVAYIDKKTTGIASDAKLTELSNSVTENTGAIEKLNGTGDGSVAKQIADSISGLNLADTYASKTTVETTYQNAISTAEQNAKYYADGLASNYATAAQGTLAVAADTLSKENKAVLDELDTTYATDEQVATAKQEAIGVAAADATTKADAAEADAIAAAKTETEDQIEALALKAISKVPAQCSDVNKYCALTYGTDGYVWEVIERAEGEVLSTDGRTSTGITPTAGN